MRKPLSPTPRQLGSILADELHPFGKRRQQQLFGKISRKTKISPPELAKQWGVDPAKIVHWIKVGELRAIDASTTRGGQPRYLIDLSDLAVFEASRSVQPPVPRVRRRKVDPNVINFF